MQEAVDSFRGLLDELARLLYKMSGKAYWKRLLKDGKYADRLAAIGKKIDKAKDDLRTVMGLNTLQLTQTTAADTQQVLTVVQGAEPLWRDTADSSSKTYELVTQMAKDTHQLTQQAEERAAPPPVDETAYAQAVVHALGKLLSVADMLNPEEGSPLRALGLQDIFVPLNVLCPRAAHERVDTSRPVSEVLSDPQVTRAVVLGGPGFGKTSALRCHLLTWATAADEERQAMDLPILVELKQFKKEKGASSLSLFDHIANKGGSAHFPIGSAALTALLRSSRRVVLLLDGLDELFEAREVVVSDVWVFINSFPRDSVRVVVTSRVVGYQQSDFVDFAQYTLRPLNEGQMKDFVRRWHRATYADSEKDVRDNRKARLLFALRNIPAIRTLAENPLLLTMIAIVNRGAELPTRRVQLYEKCVELLIAKWHPELFNEGAVTQTRDILAFGPFEKQRLLRDLALEMQEGKEGLGLIVEESQLEMCVCRHVDKVRGLRDPPIVVTRALIAQLRERHYILSYLGGTSYSFVHRTFLEYFCAARYNELWNDRELSEEQLRALFRTRGQESSWEEVLLLLSGMISSRYIGPCLAELLDLSKPLLAGHCIRQLKDRNEAGPVLSRCRQMLTASVQHGEDVAALDLLVEYWRDDDTRMVLTKLIESGSRPHEAGLMPGCGIMALVMHWQDDDSRVMLLEAVSTQRYEGALWYEVQRCLHSSMSAKVHMALRAMAESDRPEFAMWCLADAWADDDTRMLLTNMVTSRAVTARWAMHLLARTWWDDDNTRRLLVTELMLSGGTGDDYWAFEKLATEEYMPDSWALPDYVLQWLHQLQVELDDYNREQRSLQHQ